MKVVESLFKKVMVKNLFIEKNFDVGAHWNCLNEHFQCVPTTQYVNVNKVNFVFKLRLPSIMSSVSASFKHPKLPISI